MRLYVNIDHVATVREARRTDEPDPVRAAVLAELGGAHGITVHLREDRRHIQDRDVDLLMKTVRTGVNLELAAASEVLAFACELAPMQATLVPEKREEITTEGGLDLSTAKSRAVHRSAVEMLTEAGIRTSLFIDPEEDAIRASLDLGADAVELHTGEYANAVAPGWEDQLGRLARGAKLARTLGLAVHAGHGLTYENVRPVAAIEELEELNIGHSIVARSVFTGLESAVREMAEILRRVESEPVKKHWGKTVLGLAVTVFLLWWVMRDVDFREVWSNIRQGDMLLLAAAVFVATFGFFIRALRWKILLAAVKPDTALRSRFAGVSIGFMANNVLPARVGEFARAYAFSRLEPVSASAAFGSLVVERVLDGIVLLLFLVVPVLTPGFPSTGALSQGAGALALRGAVVMVGAVMVALIVMAIWPRGFVRAAERVASVLPRPLARPIVDALEAFMGSISVLRNPRLLLLGFAWTLGFWAWHGVSFWLGMLAFGIDTGFLSAIFTEAVVGFGVALPAAPGFFGTFHASAEFALSSVYGVDTAQSLAFAFGYHFGGWIPITVIGFYFAWKLGLSLGEIGGAEERVEENIEEEHPEVEDLLGGRGDDSPGEG